MIELLLFNSILLLYVLWTTARINKKADLIGHLSTVILTHLAAKVAIEIPEEPAHEWESWDKS